MTSRRSFGIATGIALIFASLVSPALAWWDAGHMQIAYVAYKKLDAPVKDKVDVLLRLNPDYARWTAGIADPKTAKLYALFTRPPGPTISRPRITTTPAIRSIAQ